MHILSRASEPALYKLFTQNENAHTNDNNDDALRVNMYVCVCVSESDEYVS